MRIAKLLLLLLMVSLIIFSSYSTHATEPEPVDCSNLLILLSKSLRVIEEGEPDALQMIHSIGNASIPGDLGNLHRSSYTLLSRYYNLSMLIASETLTKEEAQKVLGELSELYSRLPEIVNQYVSKLSACVHDPGLGNSLKTSISLSINKISGELIPHLTQVVFSKYLVLGGFVDVRLSKDVYVSGELIEFEVILRDPSLILGGASLLTWPDLRFVRHANISLPTNDRYVGSLKTPSAELVRTLARPENMFVLVVMVRNVSNNENYAIYKLLKVVYKVPAVEVECPAKIFRGDLIKLSIYSDDYYNATIKLGNLLLGNMSLTPGLTHYYINTSVLNLTTDINLLEISISPTQDSAGLRITRPLIVLPRMPKVKIMVPETFFTNDGFLTIMLVNEDPEESQLRVRLYVGNTLRGEYTLSDTLVARFFASAFPTSFTDLRVVVESFQNGKEPYLYESLILVVNPLTTLLVSLALVFLAVLISGRERSFVILIRGRVERGRISLRGVVREASSYLTSPYVVKSRIAELYYATLRRLEIPLPEVSETLREHFNRVNLRGLLRSIIWKFLMITEKDLYSRRKQDYQEALKLVEEAVGSENEGTSPD